MLWRIVISTQGTQDTQDVKIDFEEDDESVESFGKPAIGRQASQPAMRVSEIDDSAIENRRSSTGDLAPTDSPSSSSWQPSKSIMSALRDQIAKGAKSGATAVTTGAKSMKSAAASANSKIQALPEVVNALN